MPLLTAFLMLAAADPAKSCNPPSDYAHWLRIENVAAKPGAKLKLSALRGVSFYWEEVPLHCTRGWRVSNPRAVKLSRDRRSIRISKDAKPGETVEISYVVRGERESASIRIVGRDEATIVGSYRQKALIGCRQNSHVGELKLTDKGRFEVTYQPFETYVDYWGSYRFDPASGALTMKIEGGNFVPPDTVLNGTAQRKDGKLTLSGFDLGGAHPTQRETASGCIYEF